MAEVVAAQLLTTSGSAALTAAAIIMAEGVARKVFTLPLPWELPQALSALTLIS